MMNYKKVFPAFEEDVDLHPMIPEVREAEKRLDDLVKALNADTRAASQIDDAIGLLARAYEERGFLYGFNVAKALV
ncbi:MAG: hypothetical protein IJT44_07450 [Clostridia bacterium]|nr:hypothetical protein [Clostridia bacterium]